MIGRAAERLIRRSWGQNADQLAQELYAIFTSELPIDAQSVTITQPAGSNTPPLQIRQPIPGLDPLATPAITITKGNITTTFGTNPTSGAPTFGATTFGGNTFGGINGGDTTFGGIDLGGFTNNGNPLLPPTSPPPPPPLPGGSGGGGSGGGGTDLGGINFPGQNAADRNVAVPASPSDNPFWLHGVVGGKVDGARYNVSVYAKPPQTSQPIGVLQVRQAQIDTADTIPVGTETPVLCFPGLDGDTRTIVDAIMYVPVFLKDTT